MQTNIFCVIILVVLHVQPTVTQTVQCYAHFDFKTETCSDLLGEVPKDDCCMNSMYCFKENDMLVSCRLASWSEWSSWSKCSVPCLEGVRQRRRACYGIGMCQDRNEEGSIQTKPCEDKKCCPKNGDWSEWNAWNPCSVTCGTGIKQRFRTCSNPPPECDGICEGSNKEEAFCDTEIVCPTHGGWSSWGNWGHCSGTCQTEGSLAPTQQRHRTCTNPPPSNIPRGNNCVGDSTDSQFCTTLPFCPVNGNWGSWSDSSPCSVTCGVGRETQNRKCENPAPKHGGLNCEGEAIRFSLCTIPTHCPADGHWNEWTNWSHCAQTNTIREIKCLNRIGKRRRTRECVGRDYGGNFCLGENVEFDQCYDINNCKVGENELIPKVYWSDWSEWGYCKPDCLQGATQSIQKRKKVCLPDVSKYREQDKAFVGKVQKTCQPAETEQSRPCLNVPSC